MSACVPTSTGCWSTAELERVNAICRHDLWRNSVREIARLERDRQFCRHDLVHFLDVARLAYIENLERGLGVDKELITPPPCSTTSGGICNTPGISPTTRPAPSWRRSFWPTAAFPRLSERRWRTPSSSTGASRTGSGRAWPGCSMGRIKPQEPACSARRSRSATGARKRRI